MANPEILENEDSYFTSFIIERNGNDFQVLPSDGDIWADAEDLLAEIRSSFDIFELGVDTLPEGLEDIRGLIHFEPLRVFGYLEDRNGEDCSRYFGLDQK